MDPSLLLIMYEEKLPNTYLLYIAEFSGRTVELQTEFFPMDQGTSTRHMRAWEACKSIASVEIYV